MIWVVKWESVPLDINSDQLVHLFSLIRVFAADLKKPYIHGYTKSAQQRMNV